VDRPTLPKLAPAKILSGMPVTQEQSISPPFPGVKPFDKFHAVGLLELGWGITSRLVGKGGSPIRYFQGGALIKIKYQTVKHRLASAIGLIALTAILNPARGLVTDVQAFLASMGTSQPSGNGPKPTTTRSFSGSRRRR
jgi:hypothetical protein